MSGVRPEISLGARPPRRLYKYRAFSDRALNMLMFDKLFYADPTTFNDPLDTKPELVPDLPAADLEWSLQELVQNRVRAELQAAAKTLRYSGVRTAAHIEEKAHVHATRLISDARYHATNPDFDGVDGLTITLGSYIQDELLRRYDRGIVSLAERATCPLMWSHYGDQHRGICVGYSVPDDARSLLLKVQYGGTRAVRASLVIRMLRGDAGAEAELDAAVLGVKARSWAYEREWRLIDARGLRDSPLEIEEIIFGMRCEAAVKFVVARALEKRKRPVKLFEMSEISGTFSLRKTKLDTDEMFAVLPMRYRDVLESFENLDLDVIRDGETAGAER